MPGSPRASTSQSAGASSSVEVGEPIWSCTTLSSGFDFASAWIVPGKCLPRGP